MFIDVIKVFIL